jgi:hypothetical protein
MTPSQPSSSQLSSSQQPSSAQTPESAPDFAALWASARQLYPIYMELAREFVIETPACDDLENGVDSPSRESVEQAQQWLNDMDDRIQVHQLRQFLQTSSLVEPAGLIALLQHFLARTDRTDAARDKIDFLLVQYFSQSAPTDLSDDEADNSYIAQSLQPILGPVELKAPVWLNALDRVLESARRCHSLDELLHGGVLEQGRKAKAQAGDLFYLPIALVAFTRFGYLMRRVFFRLMLADLNDILDGLTELEEKGVETIDCRRAQFSAQEPIIRLRMICQSWKVMFQAEYSSGQPLRMLVDLRASVDAALGRSVKSDAGKAEQPATAKAAVAKATPAKAAPAKATTKPRAAAAAAGVGGSNTASASQRATHADEPAAKFAVANDDAPEFEVANAPQEWDPDADSQTDKKK